MPNSQSETIKWDIVYIFAAFVCCGIVEVFLVKFSDVFIHVSNTWIFVLIDVCPSV